MSEFELGQRVRFSEKLARVRVQTYGYNLEKDEAMLQLALDRMGIPRKRGSTTFRDLDWKLWVPESFADEHVHKGLTRLNYVYGIPTSGTGIVVQRVTLTQGGTYYQHDEPACWMGHGATNAYKVAFDINRKPIHVLPEHLTLLEDS
jgi:hypothetical protein